MSECCLQPLQRRLVGVTLADTSWTAATGLPEVHIRCVHYETSLRRMLFSGRSFRASQSLPRVAPKLPSSEAARRRYDSGAFEIRPTRGQ